MCINLVSVYALNNQTIKLLLNKDSSKWFFIFF